MDKVKVWELYDIIFISMKVVIFGVCWYFLMNDFIKFNIDECLKGNSGFGGLGGLFVDWKGEWLRGFIINVGFVIVMRLKIMVLQVGQKMVWEMNIFKLLIEIDFMVVIYFIVCDRQDNVDFSGIIEECKKLFNLGRDYYI